MSADLGAVTEALLFFGGPYSNLQASEALLGEARRLGVPPERIICTGDVVAYGGDPAAATDLIMRSGVHVVMGNCEESLGSSAADCGCGFAPGSRCDALSEQWFAYAAARLTDAHRAWMRGLPKRLDLTLGGVRLAVIHGGADHISQFVFDSMAAAESRRQIAALSRDRPLDGVIGGHCGLPFSHRVGPHLWHNPGVIGVPANDGTPRVWYSLVTPAAGGGLEIAHRPLSYDHQAASASILAAGLPDAYAKALISGLWPNMDILPAPERRRRGQPIAAAAIRWAPAAAAAE